MLRFKTTLQESVDLGVGNSERNKQKRQSHHNPAISLTTAMNESYYELLHVPFATLNPPPQHPEKLLLTEYHFSTGVMALSFKFNS